MRLAKNGAILGVGIYVDDVLVAENVTFTPPAVAFAASEVNGFGTMSVPAYALPEALECAVGFVGLDSGFVAAVKGKTLEARWAATTIQSDGSQRAVGCKAFCDVFPKSLPSIAVSVGEAGDNEVTFDVLRYQLFADGEEVCLVDKKAGVTRLGGEDKTSSLASLL